MVVEVLHEVDNRASSTQAFKATIFARIVSGSRISRSRFWPHEKWNKSHPLPALLLTPFFARSLTLVPRSLLLNRTETLAWVSGVSGGKGERWKRKKKSRLPIPLGRPDTQATETLATQASETTIIKPHTNPALRTPYCPTCTGSSLRTVCFVPGERNLLHFL